MSLFPKSPLSTSPLSKSPLSKSLSPLSLFSAFRPAGGQHAVRRFLSAGAAGLMLLAAQVAVAHEFKVGAIEIDHPWSRATPGGAKVAAGYFVLKNTGTTPDRLVSVSVPFAGRAEIHEMSMKDGVMTMRPLPDGIALPAAGSVALKPGSYHLMFMDLKEPLKEGALVDGTLTFEKAGTVAVQFKVEGVGTSGGGEHKGH